MWGFLVLLTGLPGCSSKTATRDNVRTDRLIDRGFDQDLAQRNLLNELARANILNQNPNSLSSGINPGEGLGNGVGAQGGLGGFGPVGEQQEREDPSEAVGNAVRPGTNGGSSPADVSSGPNRRPRASVTVSKSRLVDSHGNSSGTNDNPGPTEGGDTSTPGNYIYSPAGRPYLGE
jgi:hypothetical protein